MVVPLLNHSQYGFIHLASSTSPLFNAEEYPFLFRNIASSAVFNKAMLALMDSFKWTRVSVIFDSLAFFFRSTGNNFAKLISLTGKDLLSTIPILRRGTAISDLFTVIDSVGSRIGYYSVTVEESAIILCEAFKRRHLWPSYVHVFLDRTVDEILSETVSCTREEMIMAMEGVFTLQYRLSTTNPSALVSRMTYQDYYKEYLNELGRFEAEIGMELQENEYANSLYDQVWAFAIAMNQSLGSTSMVDGSFPTVYERTPELRRVLSHRMRNISFEGVFGPAQEVQTFVDIFQINKGNRTLIGVFNSYNGSVSSTKQLKNIPEDSFRTEPYLVPKSLAALVLVVQSALFIVIVLNTIMLVYLRREPEIKSSSLYISLIILLGCYLLCISPVFYTAYTAFYISNTTVFTMLCNLELWLSINGLSIVFIALFFRLVRIFHIFRSFRSTGKYWSDKYLFLYIFLGNSIAVVLLLLHTATDPLRYTMETVYIISDPPYYLQYAYCSSKLTSFWVILTYGWLGLILTLIVFVAIQTRHIKRKHFKDTKKVSILAFCVCATFSLFIPFSYLLLDVNVLIGGYCFKWLAFFAVPLLCQLFLFVPKVYPILFSSTKKSRNKPYISALIRTALKFTKV